MEVEGAFTDTSPSQSNQIKGTLDKATFYDGTDIVAEYRFPANNPIGVEEFLAEWSGFKLEDANHIESRATTAQRDTVEAGAGNDSIATSLGEDFIDSGSGNDSVFGGEMMTQSVMLGALIVCLGMTVMTLSARFQGTITSWAGQETIP